MVEKEKEIVEASVDSQFRLRKLTENCYSNGHDKKILKNLKKEFEESLKKLYKVMNI